MPQMLAVVFCSGYPLLMCSVEKRVHWFLLRAGSTHVQTTRSLVRTLSYLPYAAAHWDLPGGTLMKMDSQTNSWPQRRCKHSIRTIHWSAQGKKKNGSHNNHTNELSSRYGDECSSLCSKDFLHKPSEPWGSFIRSY